MTQSVLLISRRTLSRFNHAVFPLAICLALTVPSVLWLTRVSFWSSDDGDLHRWRVWEFWEAWRSGQVPVAWAPHFSYGFGSPLFGYYNPLPYLLGVVAQAWGFDAATATKLIFGIGLVSVAVGSYALALEWYWQLETRRWAALLAATTSIYSPYVLLNASHRGALGETLALGAAPWLLWAELRCLRRGEPFSYIALALSLAALILAHNLTAVLFGTIAAALALCRLVTTSGGWAARLQTTRRLAAATTLGLALAAFFWLPVLLELSDVQFQNARGSGAVQKFSYHLIPPTEILSYQLIHDYYQELAHSGMLPHLGLAQTAVIATALVVGARRRRWRRPDEAIIPIALILALYLISPLSRFAWERFSTLALFQFPWRFLSVIALLGGVAAGELATSGRRAAIVAVGLSAGLTIAGMWIDVTPYVWRSEWDTAANLREFERQTHLFGLTADDEFLPVWVKRSRWTLFDPPDSRVGGGLVPGLDVRLLEADPRRQRFATSNAAATPLVFDVFYFPTWRVEVDGQPTTPHPVGDLGLLGIDVPAGQHQIDVYQEATFVEKVGLAITAGAFLILGGWWLSAKPWRRRRLLVAVVMVAVLITPTILVVVRPVAVPQFVAVPPDAIGAAPARLLGVRFDQSRLASTGEIDVSLLVILAPDAPAEAARVHARLTDASGRVVAETDHALAQGLRPAAIWQPNLIATDQFEWWLPKAAAGGFHTLSVGLGDAPLRPVAALDVDVSALPGDVVSLPAGFAETQWIDGNDSLILDYSYFVSEPARTAGPVQDPTAGSAVAYRGEFSWRRRSDSGSTYNVVMRLVDAQETVWAQVQSPLNFLSGTARQQQALELRPPPNLPPGSYQIAVQVQDATTGIILEGRSVDRTQGAIGDTKTELLLRPLDTWPVCDCVPGDGAVLGTVLSDGIRLLGADRRVNGGVLDVTVYWQADAAPTKSYTAYVHLLDRSGKLVDQFDQLPYNGKLPTNAWSIGNVVPFAARLHLPAREGPFRLRAGMYEFAGFQQLTSPDGRSEIALGLVEPGPLSLSGPSIAFEGGVHLLGYRLLEQAGSGVLTLYWQTQRRIHDTFTVFVHIVDDEGHIVAQSDGPPELGERTTADWPLGQIIVDPHQFALPSARPLHLHVGLYRLADNYRLPSLSGNAEIDLGVAQLP